MTNMRVWREAKGWTRAELSRRTTMNASTVGQLELGRVVPYPSQVQKLAAALGLSAAQAERLLDEADGAPGIATTRPPRSRKGK